MEDLEKKTKQKLLFISYSVLIKLRRPKNKSIYNKKKHQLIWPRKKETELEI